MAQKQQPQKLKTLGTVLVAGGCGFVGSAVVEQLLNFPDESSISPELSAFPTLKSRYPSYDQKTTKIHVIDLKCVRNRYDGVTYHDADITDIAQLLKVFEAAKPDVVINTISPTWEAPKHILDKVNIEGTRSLVEVAGGKHGDWGAKGKCKVFVHTSSASVVHDMVSDLTNADERYPYVCPNPKEYYSETKVHAERIVLAANDQPELNHMLTCSVRPAGIVGERDNNGFSYGVLSTGSIAPDWQLHLQLGSGQNIFDNTYMHNVVYGLLCAAHTLLETHRLKNSKGLSAVLDNERVDGEAFLVTNDEPGYFWDTTRFLWSCYGREINNEKVWSLPDGLAYFVGAASEFVSSLTGRVGKLTRQSVKFSLINRYYSCEKLKKRCGYEPLVSIEEGLRRSVAWYKYNEKEQAKK